MPTSYTSLLGLALPATGELTGTWGTTVNDSITSLLDTAVAGTTTLTVDADVTLSTTTGSANQARQSIILWTANGTVTRNITAPAQSKTYVVINASAGTQSIVIRGAGPTAGVTIVKGEKAIVAWNGSDFVKVSTFTGSGDFTNLSYTGTLTGGTGVVNLGSGQFYKDASGNVGIGTSSPTNTLSVVGNANITGNTTLGDASTDTVQVNGYMGVGGAGAANKGLYQRNTALTGTTQYGLTAEGTFSSAATSGGVGFASSFVTEAAAFTMAEAIGFRAFNVTKGAGSTITNQHGVYINDQTQGTNNYGITSLVSSGTNKWNIYASGTAQNYFAGNVGIGTSSPSDLVTGVKNGAVFVAADVASNPSTTDIGVTTGGVSYVAASRRGTGTYLPLAFYTSGSERMRLDSSGNLGLGVTPSAWSGYGLPVLELPSGGTIMAAGGSSNWIANAYYTGGTLVYKTTAAASYFQQNAGVFKWFQAPSGTAGNAITFTQAMTLDASGNLGVGTSSPAVRLSVDSGATSTNTNFNSTNASGVTVRFQNSGTSIGDLGSGATCFSGGTAGDFGLTSRAGNLVFGTGSTERARIDTSGNLGVGTISPGYKLDVSGAINTSADLISQGANARISLYRSAGVNYFDWASGQSLYFSTQTSAGGGGRDTKMTLDSSGNLGIGTATPVDKLAVVGSASASSVVARITNNAAAVGTAATISLDPNGNGFNVRDAQIRGINVNGVTQTALAFLTANGATPVEYMRITHDGNVGIGVTAPTAKLQVRKTGAISVSGSQIAVNDTGANNSRFCFSATNSVSAFITGGSTTNPPFVWYTNDGTTEQMRIDSSGNVNISGLTASKAVFTDASKNLTSTGTLAADQGGTGQSSYAVGDLLYASTTTALSKLADVATGNSLISGGVGVAPSWGKIGLTTHVSGTLPIANGGTGATTAANALTALGGTTVGINFFDLTNPSAITFPRINADNTVSALDAATFRTAIGAGTGSGTVTSVGATSPVASSGGTAPTISLNSAYGDTLNPYGSKTANFVLAAPNGSAGAPSFRALAEADIPALSGAAKVWVNFNGTGVVAIRKDFNVTSITDNAVGDYTINFTTALADANYCYTASTKRTSTGETLSVMESVTVAPTTSALRVVVATGDTNASIDSSAVCVAVFD